MILGYNTIGASTTTTAKGQATKFTTTEAGEIYEIVCYSKCSIPINHRYGVFSDVGGANPIGTKLAETANGVLGDTYAWRTLALTTPYTFTMGETLWLREITDDTLEYVYDAGATDQHAQTNPEFELLVHSGFLAPVDPVDGLYAAQSSIYANYTPAAAGLAISKRTGVTLSTIAEVTGTPIANIANITGIS